MSPYRTILVAVDGSKAAQRGLREAIRIAAATGARLIILHVINEFYAFASPAAGGVLVDVTPSLRAAGRKVLAQAKATAARYDVEANTVLREMVVGAVADLIVREARRQRADLIVLGTHGRRGLRRIVLGSDAEQVMRAAPAPVLLVRQP